MEFDDTNMIRDREYYDSGYVSRDTEEKSKYPVVVAALAIALVIMTIVVLADARMITNLQSNLYQYLDIIEEQKADIKDLERIILEKNKEMKELKETIKTQEKDIEELQKELEQN